MFGPKPDPDRRFFRYLTATCFIVLIGGLLSNNLLMFDFHPIKQFRFYIELVVTTLFLSGFITLYFLRK